MRPNKREAGMEVYECFGCGERVERAEGGQCDECGGVLRNLGRSRDL